MHPKAQYIHIRTCPNEMCVQGKTSSVQQSQLCAANLRLGSRGGLLAGAHESLPLAAADALNRHIHLPRRLALFSLP